MDGEIRMIERYLEWLFAACLAATRTPLIRQVMNCFGSKLNLGAQDRAFWVLVRGTRGPDQHLSLDDVTVERFGVYE